MRPQVLRKRLVPNPTEIDDPGDVTDEGGDVEGESMTMEKESISGDSLSDYLVCTGVPRLLTGDGYPDYAALQRVDFQHNKTTPRNGKYGDPACDALWDHYMTGGDGARAQKEGLLEPGQGGRGSTARRIVLSAASADPAGSSAAFSSNPPPLKKKKAGADDVVMEDGPAAPAVVPAGGFRGNFEIGKASQRLSKSPASTRQYYSITFECGAKGQLSVTTRSKRFDFDAPVKQGPPKLRYFEDDDCDRVLFPIFTPSSGRAATARLNLHATMKQNSAEDWGYVQIVCVKNCELDSYEKHWPDLNFFALPESANTLGIGASRHWILKLARELCPRQFYFAFIMDDNVRSWKAVRMHSDDGMPSVPCLLCCPHVEML